jgi:glycosyltransferase
MQTYTLIIPHYNNTGYLRRLLLTVPRREDLQVIVVDDCSTKDLDRLENLKKDNNWVEWYTTGTNGGGGKARNIGLKHAEGKYLIFADSDDYFENNFDELLTKYSRMEFDIAYFSAIFESEEDGTRLYDNYINGYIANALKSRQETNLKFLFTQPWCKIIKTHLVKSNSIEFEESIISNDVRFSTQIDYVAKKIIADSSQCYVWSQRTVSTSKKLNPTKILKRLEIDLRRHSFLKSINWRDNLNYLEMMNLIDSSSDKELKRSAKKICNDFSVPYSDIVILRIKRFLRIVLNLKPSKQFLHS